MEFPMNRLLTMIRWSVIMVRPVLVVAVSVITAAICGCSGRTIPPPSAFYSAVDLDAVVESNAPKSVEWIANGSARREGGSSSNFHRNKSFGGDLKCDAQTLEQFLLALKAELPKVVEAHGGR